MTRREILRAVERDGRWHAIRGQHLDVEVAALADLGLVRIEHHDDDTISAHLTPAGAAEISR